MSLQRPKDIQDGRPLLRPVMWQGRRYMGGMAATVDGVRAILLVGGTTWWVPEAEVEIPGR